MIERKVIIDRLVSFVDTKLSEMSASNPFILIIRPIIARAVNNNIEKIDSVLKLVQDKDGKVDIEGILSEMIDNLLVAQIKKYPNILGGVELGNGSIKVNIPFLDKAIVFDSTDIESFKQNLISK